MKAKYIKQIKAVSLTLVCAVAVIAMTPTVAYAATSISEMLSPVLLLVESELILIGKRICVIMLMACGIKFAFASDVQSAKLAKEWGMRIFVGLLIMILATDIVPLFITMITSA